MEPPHMHMRLVTTRALALAMACPAALGQQHGAPAPDQSPAEKKLDEPGGQPTRTPPSDAASIETAPEPWTFSVEPGAWFVGAGGRLRMPRSIPLGTPNEKVGIENLNLDNPRFVPFGEANARKGDWRFALRGFYYDADRNSSGNFGQIGDVTFTAADTLRSSVRFASYELEGAYTFAGGASNKIEEGVYAITTKLDAVAGLRVYDVDWSIRNLGSGTGPRVTSDSGLFFQPEVGAKLNMDFARDFTIDLQVTVGGVPNGSGSSYSGDILVGMMYHPTPHVGVQAGYRSLFFGVSKGSEEGEFGFNGAMQGLYGSLVFRF